QSYHSRHSHLLLWSDGCTVIKTEDAVNQSAVDVIVYEGESVTLNCTYVTTDIRVPFLFWYIQYPNDSPKHLQSAVDKLPGLKDKFHAILDKNLKTAPLTVLDVQLSDSAVYYCALRTLASEMAASFQVWMVRARDLKKKSQRYFHPLN
uniref:Ig-like domain-containing protein n=1 Tax=Paramormyrops kingsleyae TaxID=1676925 RepID=A0A3B3Q1X6_9TELE